MRRTNVLRFGFSLIELAIVLAIIAPMLGFLLKIADASTTKDCYASTTTQLMQVRSAVERFAVSNDRFPIPARRNVNAESPTYGREVAFADIATELDSVTNGDTSVAVFGALPFQALGLTVEQASDCWGNKLAYVVTKDLADPTEPKKFLTSSTLGALSINSSNATTFLAGTGYAVISHGADQLGAAKNNYSGGSHNWCTTDGTMRTQNCDVVNTVLISTQFNDGKDAGANFFDDLIVYRGPPWSYVTVDEDSCPFCWLIPLLD